MIYDPCQCRPCPFCGSTKVDPDFADQDEQYRSLYSVTCPDCNTGGPWVVGEDAAIRTWNSRPTEPLQSVDCDGWNTSPSRGQSDAWLAGRARPCPFCGHSVFHCHGDPVAQSFMIACASCQCGGPDKPSREACLEAWNRRPVEQSL